MYPRRRIPNQPEAIEEGWEAEYSDAMAPEEYYWELTDYNHPNSVAPSLDDMGPGGKTWLEYYSARVPPEREYDPMTYIDVNADGVFGIEILDMMDTLQRIRDTKTESA